MDRKTRKLLTMYGGFHPRSDRLYVPRDKGRRGLMAIEETVRYEEQSLYKYWCVDGKVDDIMRTVKPYKKEGTDVTAKQLKAEQARNRLEGWQGKVMHGQHCKTDEEFGELAVAEAGESELSDGKLVSGCSGSSTSHQLQESKS